MDNILIYKGFVASIKFDKKREVFTCCIEHAADDISFDFSTAKGISDRFEKVVDDYIEKCVLKGKNPNKTFKGSLNIRIDKGLHYDAYRCALSRGISLNSLIKTALGKEVSEIKKLNEWK